MIFNLLLCTIIVLLYVFIHLGRSSKENKDKWFLFFAFIIMFFLVATREMTVGNDTSVYINLFKNCNVYKWSILNMNTYYERFYLICNILINYISHSPRFFLYLMSFIFNYSVYKFIKENSKNYLMSVLMYINLLFFYQSMTMMRQFLALSIILLFAYKYVKEKKFLKFILTIVVASLFHSSAIIAFFIYPIYHLKYNRRRVLYIIIGSIVLLLSLNYLYPLVSSLINREPYYLNMVGETKLGNIISTLVYLVMYIFSLFIVKQSKRQENGFFLYSLIFAAAIYFVSINMAVLSRASQYYSIFAIISLPNIVEENIKRSRWFINSIIMFFMMSYASIIMIYRPEWNSAFNYKTCIIQKGGYICE